MRHTTTTPARHTTTPDPRTPDHVRDAILAARVKRALGGIPTLRLALVGDVDAPAPVRESKEARRARVEEDCRRILGH